MGEDELVWVIRGQQNFYSSHCFLGEESQCVCAHTNPWRREGLIAVGAGSNGQQVTCVPAGLLSLFDIKSLFHEGPLYVFH